MIGKVLWDEFFNNRDWPVAAAVAVVLTAVLAVPILVRAEIFRARASGVIPIRAGTSFRIGRTGAWICVLVRADRTAGALFI